MFYAILAVVLGAILTIGATAGSLRHRNAAVQAVAIVGVTVMIVGLITLLLMVFYPPEVLLRRIS